MSGAPSRTVAGGPASEGGSEASGHLALVAVQLLFGVFPVFGRVAMDPERGFAPFAVAAGRIGFGAVVFGLLAVAVHGRGAWPPRALWGRLLGLSMLGIVANQGLFLLGLARSSAMDAGVLVCLIPVFTYGVAVVIGQERPVAMRLIGVAVALLGTMPLLLARGATLSGDHAVGNALMAVNCLCYAIYLVASKPLVTRHPPLVVGFWVYLAAVPFLPAFLAVDGLPAVASVGEDALWSLGFVLVFPTVVTYLLNLFALTRVRASTTAFYIYLQPLLAALGGAWWLGEELHAALLPAAAGIVLGGLLVLRRR